MRFNGCKCKACKAVAVGAAGLFFANYVTAYGDECWDKQPQGRIYCQSVLPEQPHTHNDQGRINWVRSPATVVSSTSSNYSNPVMSFSFKRIG
jgi:hypothetical protein